MTELGATLSIDTVGDGLSLAGEIDAHTAPLLERALAAQLVERPVIHVDLGDVTFLDSSGLRVIIEATNERRTHGGDVILRAPTAAVRRVIEISGLVDHFRLTDGD